MEGEADENTGEEKVFGFTGAVKVDERGNNKEAEDNHGERVEGVAGSIVKSPAEGEI